MWGVVKSGKRNGERKVARRKGSKSRNTISLPLDIPEVEVIDVQNNNNKHGDYIITVKSTQTGTLCQHCGRRITKSNGYGREIELRHLPILGRRVYIRLRPKRYECPHCGGKTTTQQLDWYEVNSPHTKAYDRYLMLQLVNSTVEDVSRKDKVGYDAVDGAVERCIQTGVNWAEFAELEVIGIDEIALKKGRRNFVAIVTTQQADGRVKLLGVLADRQKETVRQFLEHIPKRLRKTMIDRFHVAKNYRECVDQVRKQECRRLKKELPEPDYEELKGVMWIVRKNNVSLTPNERKKLRRLFEFSPELKLAYSFREELNSIFEMLLTKEEGKERLLKWRDKVQRSERSIIGWIKSPTTLLIVAAAASWKA